MLTRILKMKFLGQGFQKLRAWTEHTHRHTDRHNQMHYHATFAHS